jgi:hypothetical protein
MTRNKVESPDPDIVGSWPALCRAAKNALRLAKATNTPCYVMKNGRIVNLNPRRPGRRRRGSAA